MISKLVSNYSASIFDFLPEERVTFDDVTDGHSVVRTVIPIVAVIGLAYLLLCEGLSKGETSPSIVFF